MKKLGLKAFVLSLMVMMSLVVIPNLYAFSDDVLVEEGEPVLMDLEEGEEPVILDLEEGEEPVILDLEEGEEQIDGYADETEADDGIVEYKPRGAVFENDILEKYDYEKSEDVVYYVGDTLEIPFAPGTDGPVKLKAEAFKKLFFGNFEGSEKFDVDVVIDGENMPKIVITFKEKTDAFALDIVVFRDADGIATKKLLVKGSIVDKEETTEEENPETGDVSVLGLALTMAASATGMIANKKRK